MKREPEFPMMTKILRPSEKGEAKLDYVTVSKELARFENMKNAWTPGGTIYDVEPGTYARLIVGDTLLMTDTPMERRTNTAFLRRANGRVLVAGLGLGMVLHGILAKPEVTHATVLEISQDVIDLIAPSLEKYRKRLTLIHAAALAWKLPKGETWDTIYFDIWPTVTEDNLEDVARLSRRFARRLNRANPSAWMGAWMADHLRAMRRAYA